MCHATKEYIDARQPGVSTKVHCFKEDGHLSSHEGQIFIEHDYLGTMTWW